MAYTVRYVLAWVTALAVIMAIVSTLPFPIQP